MKTSITVVVENHAPASLKAEHGLALYLDTPQGVFLFDTGAGEAFADNIETLKLDLSVAKGVILSHGHRDHTGALDRLSAMSLWYAGDIDIARCSRHEGCAVHHIGMPYSLKDLERKFQCHRVDNFSEIAKGIYLTGPIPRISNEDCGGPFFFDDDGKYPDNIADESSLLFATGELITGCCHAGIINTMEYCKKHQPQIPIHTVIGGLHLNKASEERLQDTAEYLNNSSVRKLYLMHCTGDNAVAFLKANLNNCEVLTPIAGDIIEI